jgi:DNA-binding XRE family transcriptional regulator
MIRPSVKVIEWGKAGYSKVKMCSELGITVSTLYEWEKTYPEFSYALVVAMSHSEAWWEKEARLHQHQHHANGDFLIAGKLDFKKFNAHAA